MWFIFLLPLLFLICYSRELISNALKRLKLLCIGQNFRHLSLMSGENFKPKMSFAVRFVLKGLFLNKNCYNISSLLSDIHYAGMQRQVEVNIT